MATPIQEAEQLIASGNTEKALALLIKESKSVFKVRFILLSARLKRIKKQYLEGDIELEKYNAGLVRVDKALLSILNSYKLYRTIPIGMRMSTGVVLVLLIGYLSWMTFAKPKSTPKRDCAQPPKTAVYIANFEDKSEEGFRNDLIATLRTELSETIYSIAGTPYLSPAIKNYYDTIRLRHFENHCDDAGLLVNGFIEKEKGIFNCYINIVNLTIKIPGMGANKTIVLKNPAGITFPTTDDSEILSRFILAILKAHEGLPFEALKILKELEQGKEGMKDTKLSGYINFYKATAYAMIGAKEKAFAFYQESKKALPRLKLIIKENKIIAEKIEKLVLKRPDLKLFREEIIKKDSLLDLGVEAASEIDEQAKIDTIKALVEKTTKQEESPKPQDQGEDMSMKLEDKGGKNERPELPFGEFKDYKTIVLKDGKTWLAQNLSLKVKNSWCYEDNPQNCEEFGRLYTWEAAKEGCRKLGNGWHLPTDEEWTKMVDQYGGTGKEASQALIEGGSTGFAAFLGGWRGSSGSYYNLSTAGHYWSSTEYGSSNAWYYFFYNGNLSRSDNRKTYGRSVRCLQGS